MAHSTQAKKLNAVLVYFIISGMLLVTLGAVLKLQGFESASLPLLGGLAMSVIATIAWVLKK